MPKKKRQSAEEKRDAELIVTRVRREDVDRAREWMKSRRDPTLDDEAVDAMGPLVLFRRLVQYVRRDAT